LALVAILLIVSLPHAERSPSAAGRSRSAAPTGRSSGAHPAHLRPKSAPAKTAPAKTAPAKTAPAKTAAARASAGTPAGSQPVTPTTDPAAARAPALNMAAPAGFGPLLRQAWISADPAGAHLSATDVQSTMVGSVYYAAQPSIANYWAVSRFVPSEAAEPLAGTPAGNALLAPFRYVAIFYKAPGQPWRYIGDFTPGLCPSAVPPPVLAAWDLCSPAA